MISTQSIVVDFDNSMAIVASGSPTPASISMYRGTTPVLRLTVQRQWSDATAVIFHDCTYVATLGSDWGLEAVPLVTVGNSVFNQSADWASQNPLLGRLCLQLALTGTPLEDDLGTASEKVYRLQVWCINELERSVIILDNQVTVKNIGVEAS